MEKQEQKPISFSPILSAMCKPFKFVYVANFSSREKLLDVLEFYSMQPSTFEENQIGIIMPLPSTQDFSEFRFTGMFRNLIMLPDVESKLDLLAIKNLPLCFLNPNIQFKEVFGNKLDHAKGCLIKFRQYCNATDGPKNLDFFGSQWITEHSYEDLTILKKPDLPDFSPKKREFRLRLFVFRDKFRFELRERQGDIWQSDPELFLTSDESIALMFILVVCWNTNAFIQELLTFPNFFEAYKTFKTQVDRLNNIFKPLEKKRYLNHFREEQSGDDSLRSNFTKAAKVLESTGFNMNRRKDRVPIILDETAANHPHFSINNWNMVLGTMPEWIIPGKGIEIPESN